MIWSGGEGAHAACPQPGLMFICCCLSRFFSLSLHQKVRLALEGSDDDNGNTRSIPSRSSFEFGSPQSNLPAFPFSCCGHHKPKYLVCCPWAGCRPCPGGTPAPASSTCDFKAQTLYPKFNQQTPKHSLHQSRAIAESPQPPWLGRPSLGPLQGHPHCAQRLCPRRALSEQYATRNTYCIYGKGKMEEAAQNPPLSRRGCAGGKYCS